MLDDVIVACRNWKFESTHSVPAKHEKFVVVLTDIALSNMTNKRKHHDINCLTKTRGLYDISNNATDKACMLTEEEIWQKHAFSTINFCWPESQKRTRATSKQSIFQVCPLSHKLKIILRESFILWSMGYITLNVVTIYQLQMFRTFCQTWMSSEIYRWNNM